MSPRLLVTYGLRLEMFLSYNTNLQFALLIDYYLNSDLIDGGHPVHAILARHHTASILSKQSEYNLGVATIVLDFIMLIQCYLDTFLFASVISCFRNANYFAPVATHGKMS
jgi:hypothetical protein